MPQGRPKSISDREIREYIELYRSGLRFMEIARAKSTYRQKTREVILREATEDDHAEHARALYRARTISPTLAKRLKEECNHQIQITDTMIGVLKGYVVVYGKCSTCGKEFESCIYESKIDWEDRAVYELSRSKPVSG